MSKLKHLARLAAAVILATGVFAGIPGPANADPKSDQHTNSSFQPNSFDTGWG